MEHLVPSEQMKLPIKDNGECLKLKKMKINTAFTLMEPGPVVFVTTNISSATLSISSRNTISLFLEGLAACIDDVRKETRTIHSVGDGSFVVDGRKLDRREMMQSKLPEGVQVFSDRPFKWTRPALS